MRNSTIKIKTHKKCLNCSKKFKLYKTTDKFCCHACEREYMSDEKIKERFEDCKKAVKGDAVFETLQALINTIVRLIDRGQPCISSGTEYGKYVVNAGHYISRGANKTLRYHLLNIFNQSESDNWKKGGKGSTYSARLKEVFGQEVRDEIESLPAKYPTLKLTKLEAKEKCKIAGQIIKELKAQDIIFSTEYRIEVRRKLNERLGIYR